MTARHVVVVGGGLAGITAALLLADGGWSVSLVEARPRLGGAAFSFQRGPLTIDNGQHVFLRCCGAYRGLLQRLGVEDSVALQRHLDIRILRPDGHSAQLRRGPGLPAPLHLSAALARYGLLAPGDRLRTGLGALALRRLNPADPSLDVQTFGDFLRRHGQNDATISALWSVIATATLNLSPDEASLALATKVFRTGLLDHAPAADVGFATVPLSDLHSVAALRALTASGVEVLMRHRVESVEPGGLVRARGTEGERTWQADAVVLAMPHREAFAAAPALGRSPAAPASGLGATSIVNVHVIYDRMVTELPFAAAVDSCVQWFFDRTHSSGLHRLRPGGQYLAVTVSAADDIIDVPSRDLQEQFVAELGRLLPRARRASVVEAFVTRERRATFRQAAGSGGLRPSTRSGLDGIWLAGSWTSTGWPDTMESAVRSGIAAAQAVLSAAPDNAWGFAA